MCLGKATKLSRKTMKERCCLVFFLIHALVISHILNHVFIAVFAAGLKLLGLLIIFALEDRPHLHPTDIRLTLNKISAVTLRPAHGHL